MFIFFFKLAVILVLKHVKATNVHFVCHIYFCMPYICRKRALRTSIPGLPWWWNLENMFSDTGKLWKHFDRARLKWSSLPTTLLLSGIVIWKFRELIHFWYIFHLIFGFGVEKMKMKSIGFKVYSSMRMGTELSSDQNLYVVITKVLKFLLGYFNPCKFSKS